MIPIWQGRTISQCYKPIMKREKSGVFFFCEDIFNAALNVSFLFLSAPLPSPTKANSERQKSTFPSLPWSSLCDCAINDKVLNGKEKEKKMTLQRMMNAIQKYMSSYSLKLQNKESKILEQMQTFRRDNSLSSRFPDYLIPPLLFY